ncbi:MAG: hypothetical protein M0R51_15690 [Clostridia bacterium]|jgi:hypothetical protein|nr:hypothetical protein [Clostridia bacterium]
MDKLGVCILCGVVLAMMLFGLVTINVLKESSLIKYETLIKNNLATYNQTTGIFECEICK